MNLEAKFCIQQSILVADSSESPLVFPSSFNLWTDTFMPITSPTSACGCREEDYHFFDVSEITAELLSVPNTCGYCAGESSASKPMAAVKVLQSLPPAVHWLQSSCRWAAQSLLAHSLTDPAPQSGYPLLAQCRCSLIATGMAMDKLLRILPPELFNESISNRSRESRSSVVGTHSVPAHIPPATSTPLSKFSAPVGSSSRAAAAAATAVGAFTGSTVQAGTHSIAAGQPAGLQQGAAAGNQGMGDALEEEPAVRGHGKAWRAAQQALLALLEQEHPAGSAAHAWQVRNFQRILLLANRGYHIISHWDHWLSIYVLP